MKKLLLLILTASMLLSLASCAEKEPPEDTEYVAYVWDTTYDGNPMNANFQGLFFEDCVHQEWRKYEDPEAPETFEISLNGRKITSDYLHSRQDQNGYLYHVYDDFTLSADYTLYEYEEGSDRKTVPPESRFSWPEACLPALRKTVYEISGVNVDDYYVTMNYNKEYEVHPGGILPAYYGIHFWKYVDNVSTTDRVSLCINLDGTIWSYKESDTFGKMPDQVDFEWEYIQEAIDQANKTVFAEAIEEYDEFLPFFVRTGEASYTYSCTDQGVPFAVVDVNYAAYNNGKLEKRTLVSWAILQNEAPEGYVR